MLKPQPTREMKVVAMYQLQTPTLTITKMPEVAEFQSMILVTSKCATEMNVVS